MIEGANESLKNQIIDYVFISTHSEDLHTNVIKKLIEFEYRIEVSSDLNIHTTSHDGFVMASAQRVDPVFNGFSPLGRLEINNSNPKKISEYISSEAKKL